MAWLQESIAKFVDADQFLDSKREKDKLLQCLQHVQTHPVCPCCLIELPSSSCQEVGVETCRYRDGTVIRGFCGKKALYDGSISRWRVLRESLRYRLRAE